MRTSAPFLLVMHTEPRLSPRPHAGLLSRIVDGPPAQGGGDGEGRDTEARRVPGILVCKVHPRHKNTQACLATGVTALSTLFGGSMPDSVQLSLLRAVPMYCPELMHIRHLLSRSGQNWPLGTASHLRAVPSAPHGPAALPPSFRGSHHGVGDGACVDRSRILREHGRLP